ncbi:MAG: hypothetical protein RLZZ628_2024 [Bacteroidota bacterium]|jgi:hypothetical protein
MTYRLRVDTLVKNQSMPYISKFICFFNLGTTLVSLDGFVLLPGDSKKYDLQGENACIEVPAEVKFGAIVGTPTFQIVEGNCLRVEYLECF